MKKDFSRWIESRSTDIDELFAMLADQQLAADEQLPDTGIGLEWERMLSARFIRGEEYGTRASTVYLVDHQGVATFVEKSFDEKGRESGRKEFRFALAEA